jgi:hypothetical protein
MHELEALNIYGTDEHVQARQVSARPIKTAHKACSDRITADLEYNRNCGSRSLCRKRRVIAANRDDNTYLLADQI